MEKLTEKFNKLKKVFEKNQSFLLLIHPNPDGDALGSAFAIQNYLEKKRKKIAIISPTPAPKEFESIFPIDKIKINEEFRYFDCLIILDRGDVYQKFNYDQQVQKENSSIDLVNIDHHPDTAIEKALNILDSSSPATCEIIYRFFDHLEERLDPKISQSLLTGIYTDTGGFRHNNTTPESLEIAGNLMRSGASITKINKQIFLNKSINTLKLWSIALERAKLQPKSGMIISFLTKKDLESCGATSEDISGISEILNTIAESKFSLVLSESERNSIKASLRSDEHKGVDVSQIARRFKGGGHKLASGFEIKGRLKQVGDSWIIE